MFGKRIGSLVAITGAILSFATSAHATTFDFVQYADGHEGIPASNQFVEDDITLTVTARNKAGNPLDIYLDDADRNGPAGLGVCSKSSGGFCADTGSNNDDDDVERNEFLVLDFGQEVELDQVTFVNGAHQLTFDGKFGLSVDGGKFVKYTMAHLFDPAQLLLGTIFTFIAPEEVDPNHILGDTRSFYLSSISVHSTAVPEPMTMSLLGLGLIPLVRRRLTGV